MKRRTVIGGLGATLGAGLAGCTGFGSAAEPTDSGETATPTETVSQHDDATPGGDGTAQSETDGPAVVRETVVVSWEGTPEDNIRPHDLRFWNVADRRRELTVTVSPDDPETLTGLTTSHHVPSNEAVAIELRQPATYGVTVQVDGTQVTTFELGENWFDCNNSFTRIEIAADDSVDRTEVSTMLACTDATVSGPTERDG